MVDRRQSVVFFLISRSGELKVYSYRVCLFRVKRERERESVCMYARRERLNRERCEKKK